MKTKLLITILFLMPTALLFSQTVSNISATQVGKEISISYNITGANSGDKFEVKIYCSTDGGKYWGNPLKYVTGDVGKEVTGGYSKKINWRVTDERDKLEGDKIKFKITATQQNFAPKGMVLVQGGTFQMGSNSYNSEKPVHNVTVSSFYISKYEVTFAEYDKFCDATGRSKPDDEGWGRGNRPVMHVSWNDATAYCNWLSQKTGQTYRLPTEAEWEYAAGGGQNSTLTKGAGGIIKLTKWAGTNSESSLGSYAWYRDNSGNKTHPVGTKSPNSLGIYDMSGNVWEWCSDRYGDYSSSSQTNPTGASSGSFRVNRGGGWYFSADACRVAFRGDIGPTDSFSDLGFRLVRAF